LILLRKALPRLPGGASLNKGGDFTKKIVVFLFDSLVCLRKALPGLSDGASQVVRRTSFNKNSSSGQPGDEFTPAYASVLRQCLTPAYARPYASYANALCDHYCSAVRSGVGLGCQNLHNLAKSSYNPAKP